MQPPQLVPPPAAWPGTLGYREQTLVARAAQRGLLPVPRLHLEGERVEHRDTPGCLSFSG
jgi:hypothetical protein